MVVYRSDELNFSSDNMTLYDSVGDYEQLLLLYDYLTAMNACEEIHLIDARVPIIKMLTFNGVKIDMW